MSEAVPTMMQRAHDRVRHAAADFAGGSRRPGEEVES